MLIRQQTKHLSYSRGKGRKIEKPDSIKENCIQRKNQRSRILSFRPGSCEIRVSGPKDSRPQRKKITNRIALDMTHIALKSINKFPERTTNMP